MGFLFRVAAGTVVGLITVLIVLATLIDNAMPADERTGQGPVYLLAWFTFLALLWFGWWVGGKALKAVLRR